MGKYVVIDLEMCKVPRSMKRQYSKRREIIQIGAVLLDETFQIVDQFNAYVSPEFGCLDAFIHQLTGISGGDLKEASNLLEVMTQFMKWLPKDDVQMVSWSETDKYQIKNELAEKKIELEGMDAILEKWIDCQKQFGDRLEASRCYSLRDALIMADIDGREDFHDGLADAYNTALLFRKLQTEKSLSLNPVYEASRQETVEHLQFTMGDLFAGIKLEIKSVA